jgi:hypothetical protein
MLLISIGCLTRAAGALDLDLYAELLERHTLAVDDIASTRVDYAALRKSSDWTRLVDSLEKSEPKGLTTREERFAFWINAYNILTIDLVRRNYPVDSIRSIGSFFSPVWKRPAGKIGGRAYTLDEIENEILRPMGEPRIHAAIVCASLSCPPLRREPYRSERLAVQLEDNVRRWLADPRKGVRIERSTKTIQLSRIFDWFAGDFKAGVLPFVSSQIDSVDADWIRSQGKALQIRYFDYDWSLNDTGTRPR